MKLGSAYLFSLSNQSITARGSGSSWGEAGALSAGRIEVGERDWELSGGAGDRSGV
jgi:hypothetical protein